RALSHAHPLHVDVAAVPHRQRLVRRLPPADRRVAGGGHGRHLRRAALPHRRGAGDVRDRLAAAARDARRGPGRRRAL
ncbi:MAG: Uncharacterized MFS-type transporter, partial [uncultured Gemmatimonadaceae bacterium]